jgi:UDPglucose--hexose-1-phosphate uridylyltransferase
MQQFRKDPVSGRWVIISAERAQRPQHHAVRESSANTGPCPFCAGNEAMTPPPVLVYQDEEAPAGKSLWKVRVVPNKYPALASDDRDFVDDDALYKPTNGLGVHEVIIESPDHIENIATLTEKQVGEILFAYRDRIMSLRTDPRWRYILIYKNQGLEAGATLPHVHSQLVALPMVPQAVAEEMSGAKRYYHATGECIYCKMINKESAGGQRLVAEYGRFAVLCPYAPRFPFEAWILPRQHASCFEMGSKEDYVQLSHALRETLIRLDRQLDHPPFNYIIHSNPLAEADGRFYHWHMEILPKLTQVAGFEWGSGCYINPVAPEEAARRLREGSS